MMLFVKKATGEHSSVPQGAHLADLKIDSPPVFICDIIPGIKD